MVNTNNLDMARFVAAIFVIFGHSYPLAGFPYDDPLLKLTGILNFGLLGVIIFMTISGYLTVKSWEKSNGNILFNIYKRVVRIAPALIASLVFSTFILAPLVSTLGIWGYFTALASSPLPTSYYLPGVFTTNPFPDAVNGSLWIVPLLFMAYAWLYIFGNFNMLKRGLVLPTTLVTAAILVLVQPTEARFIPYYIMFFVGTLAYVYRDSFPKWNIPCVKEPWGLKSFFGVFLYAFPIQQTVMHLLPGTTPVLLFALSTIITIPIAIISWAVIEVPAARWAAKVMKI